MSNNHDVPAVITTVGVPGRSEPYARLADGRIMPMGWNMGKTYRVGQTGRASYVRTSYASLWRFVPDDDERVPDGTYGGSRAA